MLRRLRRRFLSRSPWARRPPLIYLSFYLELPFDAGFEKGGTLRKIHLAEGPLEEWSDLDLDDLLGMDPYEVPGLTGTRVRYTIVGPLSLEDRRLAWSLRGRSSVTVRDWVSREELLRLSASHDVSLGIFGGSAKARRVVPTKLFQAAAQGHALVTSDSPPQRRLLGRSASYVPIGQHVPLAEALLGLSRDRVRVATMGREARRAVKPYVSRLLVRPIVEHISQGSAGRVVFS